MKLSLAPTVMTGGLALGYHLSGAQRRFDRADEFDVIHSAPRIIWAFSMCPLGRTVPG